MDHGRWSFSLWSNFHGPISYKIQFTKFLGSSLGLNRMWTKRNDHASKSDCVDFFFNISLKTAVLGKKNASLTIFLSSFVFIFSSPRKHFIINLVWWYFSTMDPYFSLPEHLFYLSHRKTCWTMLVNNVGHKYVFQGPWMPWSLWQPFLGVNRSGPGRSSTANHKFYMGLGWFHGPWCKQPLKG